MLTLLPPAKIRKLTLICLFICAMPAVLSAQNLFLQTIDICNPSNYCMDCGDVKATCDQFNLDYIADNINRKYSLKEAFGSITFQVLVDDHGFPCVYSHTDNTNSPLTADLIRFLNGNIWKAARINGKPVNASVNVIFRFAYGAISGRMQRMDLEQLKPPGDPTIYNTTAYKNPSLKNYQFITWTRYNSPLPDNVSKYCAIDKADVLWYATDKGLTRFNGTTFDPINEFNSPFIIETAIHNITVDKDNAKWVYANDKIYKYTDAGWQIYDFQKFLASGVNNILNSRHGDLLFATKTGLVVKRDDKVVVINKRAVKELPSNDITYAYNDSHKHLWIGTAKGNIVLDRNTIATTFDSDKTPLRNVTITGAVEDEKGNIYFSLVDYNNTSGDDNDKEGLAVLKPNGKWLHFTDKNSGLPSNRINTMMYDKFEHVLWIGTDKSGLVRYDLDGGWENYNNNNSAVPGFKIYQLVQDSKGLIYATTANGLLRIKKK
ncbi:MAG: two-component regulator propeller domain-containing protein [Mucilaginibacter sp.]|uniref:ligand-binding sensor domain-containing protein n=1 Tax=Mucilaginibacter sp. TaxID=1882438 RepID=UPI0031B3DEF8